MAQRRDLPTKEAVFWVIAWGPLWNQIWDNNTDIRLFKSTAICCLSPSGDLFLEPR